MASYLGACYSEFDHVLLATVAISQNGDDAIELFYNGSVIETFGEVTHAGSSTISWRYSDSWAYKDASGTVTFDSTSYWILEL